MLKLQPLKLKFGAFATCASLLSGCAGPTLTSHDLMSYNTSCEQVEQQIAFLNENAPGRMDQIWAGLQVFSMGRLTPDYERKARIADGSTAYWIQGIKEDYYRKCLKL